MEIKTMSDDEMLIQLHEAEALFQEHGIEVLRSEYNFSNDTGVGFINLTLIDKSIIFTDFPSDGIWELYHGGKIICKKYVLEELIQFWKSL